LVAVGTETKQGSNNSLLYIFKVKKEIENSPTKSNLAAKNLPWLSCNLIEPNYYIQTENKKT